MSADLTASQIFQITKALLAVTWCVLRVLQAIITAVQGVRAAESLYWQINSTKHEVLMVKSRTGKDLLMLNGYTYYQHKHLRDGFRWSCTQMGSRSCRGFLHVDTQMMVVRAQTEHTHPPSTYFLEKIRQKYTELLKECKTSSEEENEAPKFLKIKSIQGRVGF